MLEKVTMGALSEIRFRRHSRYKIFVYTSFVVFIVFLIVCWNTQKSKPRGVEPRRHQTFDYVNTSSSVLNNTQTSKEKLTPPPSKEDEQMQPKRRVAIIIVSSKRSGSSFIGDIFNHHPRLFYIFEPLFQLSSYYIRRHSNISEVTFNKLAIARINESCHCLLRDPYADTQSVSRDLCSRNAILKRNKLCHNSLRDDVIKKWNRACADQDSVAIKLIRIQDIADLEPLSHSLDLRIIHLVRDPRPTERSRKKTGNNADLIRRKGKNAVDEVDLCEHIDRNFKYFLNPPEWLVGHYLLVRYEDVALSPMSKTEEMFRFTGYDLHDNVIRWVKESTSTESKGTFSTKRNSSVVLDSWRKDMAWSFVKQIQNACEKPMERLGYVPLRNEEELRNTSIKTTIDFR